MCNLLNPRRCGQTTYVRSQTELYFARERGETPASFGYDQGSASKYPGPEFGKQRFAGDVFKGLGVEGVFGEMSNNRDNAQAQSNLQLFMSQYTNGLFSPIPPAPPTDQMA